MNDHPSSSVLNTDTSKPGGSLVLLVEADRKLAAEIRLDLEAGGHMVHLADTVTGGVLKMPSALRTFGCEERLWAVLRVNSSRAEYFSGGPGKPAHARGFLGAFGIFSPRPTPTSSTCRSAICAASSTRPANGASSP